MEIILELWVGIASSLLAALIVSRAFNRRCHLLPPPDGLSNTQETRVKSRAEKFGSLEAEEAVALTYGLVRRADDALEALEDSSEKSLSEEIQSLRIAVLFGLPSSRSVRVNLARRDEYERYLSAASMKALFLSLFGDVFHGAQQGSVATLRHVFEDLADASVLVREVWPEKCEVLSTLPFDELRQITLVEPESD